MPNPLENMKKNDSLLGALNAVYDRRAFATLFSTFALLALLMTAFAAGAASLMFNGHFGLGKVVGGVGVLFSLATTLIGVSATGFLLNDSVRARPQKSIKQALLESLATLHRIIGVLLSLSLVVLLAVLIVFVAVLLCRTPGVGALLYAFVFPVGALFLGAIAYAGFFVVSLHGPAIWEGNGVLRTLAILGTIFRQRLFPAMVQMILLALLVGLVAALVFGCISSGVSFTGAISLPVLGQGIGSFSPDLIFGKILGGHNNGAEYLGAAAFGMALLGGLAITAPLLVAISGNCIIFASVTESVSIEEIDQKLQYAVDAARTRAEHARRQLDEARNRLNTAPGAIENKDPRCPHCAAPAEPDDIYCGSCGKRII